MKIAKVVLFASVFFVSGCPHPAATMEGGTDAADVRPDTADTITDAVDHPVTIDASDVPSLPDVAFDGPTDAPPADVHPDAPGTCSGLAIGGLYRTPSDPATYFLSADCRKHLFVNEAIYISWFPDFSGVQTDTSSQLIGIPDGTLMTVRPGTWLVKTTVDQRTYAVTRCGVLHWISSMALAVTLYGPMWNDPLMRLIDIDSTYSAYTHGSDITTAVHPDGTLITYADAPGVYYVMQAGQRRPFSPGALTANRFQTRFAVTTTIIYPDGPPVTGYEPALADVCVP